MAGTRWSVRQVLDRAPDAQSGRAAQALASPRTWSDLGCTEALLWGKCQGSGHAPYQVTVDLTEPAFRCTCPSRKFPCKHGLALLLLWVEHGDAVGHVAQPAAFAEEWVEQRRAAAARRRTRPATDAVTDPVAQARRQAEREATMTVGLDEFERWLGDLLRQGLAAARRQPYSFWDAAAARLVDAQIPALAERVRDMGGVVHGTPRWADELLAETGRWYLAGRAWRRRATLSDDEVGDLRAFLGWPRRSDDVAGFPRLDDHWVVAGLRQTDDGRILSQHTWLWGTTTNRWMVLLDFAAAGAALQVSHVVGSVIDDALVVYPGNAPQRAALSGDQQVVGEKATPAGDTIAGALDRVADWLAANPWRGRLPLALADVVLVEDGGAWWLEDLAGDRLPVARGFEPWPFLALSGGAPGLVIAEWDRAAVHPLVVRAAEPVSR